MIKPSIQPKEPTRKVATKIRSVNATSGLIKYIIPTLYNTLNLSQ